MDPRPFSPEVKPEIVFVFELVRYVTAGKLRIPNFQRAYVWRRTQMLELLDSIRRRYPIGSLLVWDTSVRISSRPNIGPIPVPRQTDGVSSHVLDGHQRLSTLAGTLMAPPDDAPTQEDEDPGRWEIWYNAQNDQFEHLRTGDQPEARHFPMRKLMDTIAFIGECERILRDGGKEDGDRYVRKVQELLQVFNEYKLPIVRISNTDLNQAVDIFARLNSKGQAMSADQMVSALTYREANSGEPSLNLSENIDVLIRLLDGYGFGDIDRTIVLRGLLACLGEDIYRTDWTGLADEKRGALQKRLPEIIEPATAAMERAARFLNGIGVYSDRLLPYAMQLVVLTAFFRDCEQPTTAQEAFLQRWFWVSSYAGWFASGNPSRVGHLVAEMRDKVSHMDHPSSLEFMRIDEPAQPFPKVFDMRSARARTWLLALLSLHPRGSDGEPLPDPWRLVAEHRSNAVGYIAATVNDKDLKSSPANRILRVDPKDRSQGVNWLLKLEGRVRDAVLESHGIPPDSWGLLEAGDRVGFLTARREHLIHLELQHMQREGVTPPPDPTPQAAAIDTE